jgi:1-acyl-sn-glycerol-3-phosphate acyltransferase
LGRKMRAHSGIGRLAEQVPEARIVCCAISGTTDYVRTPRRPRVRIEFFEPTGGGMAPDEQPADFAKRLLGEIRERVPPAPAGRDPDKLAKRLGQHNPNYRSDSERDQQAVAETDA